MKKRILVVIAVLVSVFIIGSIVENLKPKDIRDEMFFNINPVEETEFISDIYKINKENLCTYAFLNSASADNGNDEFVITVAKLEGIRNNRYEIYSFAPQKDDILLNPSYNNISYYPDYEVKKGDNYYGSVYMGIIPADCKKLTIDGTDAVLKKYSIKLNGKTADFIFYSCFVEQKSYPESVKIDYEKTDEMFTFG